MAVAGSRIALLGVGRLTKFHFLDMNNPGSRSGIAFYFIVYGAQLPYNLFRLRHDLYNCVEWGVKLCSLTRLTTSKGPS